MSKYTEAITRVDYLGVCDFCGDYYRSELNTTIIEALEIADRLERADVYHHFDRIAELRISPLDGDYYYIKGYEDALKDIRGDAE